MAKDVIIALDFPSGKIALDFLKKFEGESVYVKIGMELFYKEGPSIVREIKKLGHKIFLDLKILTASKLLKEMAIIKGVKELQFFASILAPCSIKLATKSLNSTDLTARWRGVS